MLEKLSNLLLLIRSNATMLIIEQDIIREKLTINLRLLITSISDCIFLILKQCQKLNIAIANMLKILTNTSKFLFCKSIKANVD